MAPCPAPSMRCTHLLQQCMHRSNISHEVCDLLLHLTASGAHRARGSAACSRVCGRAAGVRWSYQLRAAASATLPSCISARRVGPGSARSCAAACKAGGLQPLVQLCYPPPERQLADGLTDMARQPPRLFWTEVSPTPWSAKFFKVHIWSLQAGSSDLP
jgi:hypothetical protein